MTPNKASAYSDETDLMELVRRAWARKWLILACGLVGIILAIVHLHVATPKYTATIKVTPAPGSASSMSRSLGGLGGLASMAGLSLDGSSGGATSFDLYMSRLGSKDTADVLAEDQRIMTTVFSRHWDAEGKKWREPASLTKPLKKVIGAVFPGAIAPWSPPSSADLQNYLKDQIDIKKPAIKDAPITTISFQHRDADFARYLLVKLNDLANEQVRIEALNRSSKYAAHLSSKLKETVVVEYRAALADALKQQEEAIMMASVGMPYAAMHVEAPAVSKRPTSPQVGTLVVAYLLGAMVLGIAYAVFDPREIRSRLARNGASSEYLSSEAAA